jgi:hypothetical protein
VHIADSSAPWISAIQFRIQSDTAISTQLQITYADKTHTGSPVSTQLRRLSIKVSKLALQLHPNKRANDAQIIDYQGSAIIEAQKLFAITQLTQLLRIAANEQKARELPT